MKKSSLKRLTTGPDWAHSCSICCCFPKSERSRRLDWFQFLASCLTQPPGYPGATLRPEPQPVPTTWAQEEISVPWKRRRFWNWNCAAATTLPTSRNSVSAQPATAICARGLSAIAPARYRSRMRNNCEPPGRSIPGLNLERLMSQRDSELGLMSWP